MNFPTVNALYPNNEDLEPDVFVFKLNAAGDAVIYSTYLGGSDDDSGHAIAVDTAGNAYVAGETVSSDFPTVNALHPTHSGPHPAPDDAFSVTIASDETPETLGLTLAPAETVVARGATLSYRAEGTNQLQDRQCFDYWTNVTLPGGQIYPLWGGLFGPVNVCLDPGQTLGAGLNQPIPLTAPLGTCTYNAYLGSHPDIWKQASFQFQIAD